MPLRAATMKLQATFTERGGKAADKYESTFKCALMTESVHAFVFFLVV